MSVILGLLIFCLGIYFLSLFFQVARLEKVRVEAVALLERYMIVKHSLGNKKKDPAAGAEAADSGGNPAPAAKP
jgi:hypothetical protein